MKERHDDGGVAIAGGLSKRKTGEGGKKKVLAGKTTHTPSIKEKKRASKEGGGGELAWSNLKGKTRTPFWTPKATNWLKRLKKDTTK